MSVSAAELAERTRRRHRVRIDRMLAERFLEDWLVSGVVEEVLPGRFRLSDRGAAMFAGWIQTPLNVDDEDSLA